MWVLKYIICIIRKHIFAAMSLEDSPYQYCLRCGKVELEHLVTTCDEPALHTAGRTVN